MCLFYLFFCKNGWVKRRTHKNIATNQTPIEFIAKKGQRWTHKKKKGEVLVKGGRTRRRIKNKRPVKKKKLTVIVVETQWTTTNNGGRAGTLTYLVVQQYRATRFKLIFVDKRGNVDVIFDTI